MFKVVDNVISLTRGDTGLFRIELTDETGAPLELDEGDSVVFTVRKSPTGSDIFIQKTGLEVEITPDDTARLSFGKYSYDVEYRRSDGLVQTVIIPTRFELLPEVTY